MRSILFFGIFLIPFLSFSQEKIKNVAIKTTPAEQQIIQDFDTLYRLSIEVKIDIGLEWAEVGSVSVNVLDADNSGASLFSKAFANPESHQDISVQGKKAVLYLMDSLMNNRFSFEIKLFNRIGGLIEASTFNM